MTVAALAAATAPATYRAPSVVDPLLAAYAEDYRAILLTGQRELDDLVVGIGGRLRTIEDELRRVLFRDAGLALVEYSLAGGLFAESGHLEPGDREALVAVLQLFGSGPSAANSRAEPVRAMRALASALRTPPAASWADGRDLRLAVVLRHFEHLGPGGPMAAAQSEEQLVAIEIVSELARSLALRQSGHLLLVQGREDYIDELVRRNLYELRLPLPDGEEKRAFVEAAARLYDRAAFASDLDLASVARLTERLPNRGVEALLRASHRHGRPLRVAELVAQKATDVLQISEGTLRLLNTERVNGVDLRGRVVGHAKQVLESFALALRSHDPAAPANVLLVGPPGTGKTDLVIDLGHRAGVPAFELVSPKHSLVGETERRANLQMRILRDSGGIGLIDEITEAFPTERSSFDGDSGASRAVLAAQLTWLSDESRRGKVMVVGTTNCPWRMSRALIERFTVVPVLQPLLEDFPSILISVAKRVDPSSVLDDADPQIVAAAMTFHDKGASPRHMRQALSQARLLAGSLTPARIRLAAEDMLVVEDRASALLAELCAIRACTLRSFLPWSSAPAEYRLPSHFCGIVDPASGEVYRDALDIRIRELEPQAHV